jgi:DNA-binding GntR family transcriptional regulator
MALKKPALVLKSLREQVYDFLKERMIRGELRPGAYLNLKAIAGEIGVSMTPLRDALLQLDREGFITILPRRGVMVAPLTSEKIRDIYEIIGALEAVSLVSSGSLLNREALERMGALNSEMLGALENDNFDLYYTKNLAFHNAFLDLSPNEDLVQMVRTFKQRLYDFLKSGNSDPCK